MFAYRRKKRSTVFATPVKPRRQPIMTNWRRVFLAVAAILIPVGVLYLVIWSPVFKIKHWSVEFENFTAQAEARDLVWRYFESKIWKIFPRSSWLIFSGEGLTKEILSAYPEAETVSVKRNILKGVGITINGRQAAALWCKTSLVSAFMAAAATTTAEAAVIPQGEKCFFMDREGLIFREAPAISGTALPTFFGRLDENFQSGDQAAASSTIQFVQQAKKELFFTGIDAAGFMLGAPGGLELAVFTGEGWAAYFDASRSALSQVKVLAALLNDEIKAARNNLRYVDLRVAGKAYYR